ncbi:MAG TPA: hypothetical protein V6D34_02475 [Candidatus Sericytochromatia bacterium]
MNLLIRQIYWHKAPGNPGVKLTQGRLLQRSRHDSSGKAIALNLS